MHGVGPRGEPNATFGVWTGGGTDAIGWQRLRALTIAELCALRLEVLNAPNPQLANRAPRIE